MTFDQWTEAMAKELLLPSDEDLKVKSKFFEMVDEDLLDEES